MKTDKVFALDLGTTKFCFAHLKKVAAHLPPQIETISVNAKGMRRGMLCDFKEAQKALLTLIDIAETEFKTNISKIVVGIAGSHLESDTFTAATDIHQSTVNEGSLDELKNLAYNKRGLRAKEFLHAIPISYSLDERESTKAPIGFSANKLSGSFFRIAADRNYLNDVINLCNNCGLEVRNIYAEPYASACSTLSEEEKLYGVMIADIGGGTTDGLIFHNGCPTHLFTANIGGMLMTHDLSLGLGITHSCAEKLKQQIGLNKANLKKNITVQNLQNENIEVSTENYYMILFSRILELTQMIKIHIKSSPVPLPAGLVITGGGAEVQAIEQIMSYILKIPVRKMLPNPCNQFENEHLDSDLVRQRQLASKYSTVSGMLILDSLSKIEQCSPARNGVFEKYLQNFISWIKELS